MKKLYYTCMESPVGTLLLLGDGESLLMIDFHGGRDIRAEWTENRTPFEKVIVELKEYFQGERKSFDVPVKPVGTPFQQKVWEKLFEIPYGETVSYGGIAHRLGKPKAARAVGSACKSNPIPIIIPCHRVIGSNGNLTGFGGGLEIKRMLLSLESEMEMAKKNKKSGTVVLCGHRVM